jgi:hypothetical protein
MAQGDFEHLQILQALCECNAFSREEKKTSALV